MKVGRFQEINGEYKLWQVDHLLGNDRERSSHTTAVTEHSNNWKQQQKNCVFCAVRIEMLQAGQMVTVR